MDTPWSDGVPGLSQRPIQSGSQYLYKWKATQFGSYLYHAHRKGQISDGLFGAIYIHPDASIEKPFHLISNEPAELASMESAESTTRPIVLSDWRKLTSDEFWASQIADGFDSFCVDALLVNGKGSISCLSQETFQQVMSPKMKALLGNHSLTDIG